MLKNFDVNLLKIKEEDPQEPKSKIFGKFIFYLILFFVVLLIAFSWKIIPSGEKGLGFFQRLGYLLSGGEVRLKGEENDRINILLLGMGGGNHEGPNLTDTIILASLKPSTGQAALISIPRDLLAPIPGYGWRKINEANAFGEAKNTGSGGDLARETASTLFGLDIPYYLRVDFDGFTKIIDEIGGIKIYVENSFTDSQYPDEKFGTKTIAFSSGWQEMNGERALEFTRSRHASGAEGSDFARSKRQAKILSAIKDKIFSINFLFKPGNISTLISNLRENIATNLEFQEIVKLANLARQFKNQDITTKTLDDSPAGMLKSEISPYDGAYMLMPQAGSFQEIRDYIKNIFVPQTERPKIIKIEIQNGTDENGLASRTGLYLENLGYKITSIANSPRKNPGKTLLYNIREGNKENEADLKSRLDADIIQSISAWFTSTNEPEQIMLNNNTGDTSADFLIILGSTNRPISEPAQN